MIQKQFRAISTLVALLSLLGSAATSAQDTDTDGDGLPDVSEPLLGTDPMQADTDGDGQNDLADSAPAFAERPFEMGGSPATFVIAEAMVENNYDPAAKKDATDHLELVIGNQGATPLSGLTAYYTITDNDDGKTEAYVSTLDGVTVPAGGDVRLHFDDALKEGHFRANPNGIYSTSEAGKTFVVSLAAPRMEPVSVEIAKDPGGAEEAD